MLNWQHVHKNEKYYKHAAVFDPDRWDVLPSSNEQSLLEENHYDKSTATSSNSNSNNSNLSTSIFFPFGDGPRNCIGQKLAMLEMKILLARMILKYDISLNPQNQEPGISHTITLRPTNGIYIQLKPTTKSN